ncbi:hypothetical protein [Rosistilla oblonga]|uniref:hypothetical protein n=1 Tax=Rosistilla oblonga TaxID=2527990 RepID=UPI003A977B56
MPAAIALDDMFSHGRCGFLGMPHVGFAKATAIIAPKRMPIVASRSSSSAPRSTAFGNRGVLFAIGERLKRYADPAAAMFLSLAQPESSDI